MKENKIKRRNHRGLLVLGTLLAFLFTAFALVLSYEKIRSIWAEQCVLTDIRKQVSITSGKMVRAGVLAEEFGLRTGANLADIDFAAKRDEILRRIPNLRTLSVQRLMPDRVIIEAEERTPAARVCISGRRADTGCVVDSEGVVFLCQRNTSSLPVIRERASARSKPGDRLSGRSFAALRLLERARDAAVLELGVLEVDTSHQDYLTATLGDYSRAKFAWEGMDEPDDQSDARLAVSLKNLRDAIRTKAAPSGCIWNVTDPSGRIYADTKGQF